MKLVNTFVIFAGMLSIMAIRSESKYMYQHELNSFKQSETFKTMFDKNDNYDLASIRRDIENYPKLSPNQRMLLINFLSLDCIVLTGQAMPQLYGYIETMCKSHHIQMPIIFITRNKNSFFNAFALKLLASSGGIVIGQQLIYETNDAQLEGVIAHEIGHIKYNHANKTLLLKFGLALVIWQAIKRLPRDFVNYNTYGKYMDLALKGIYTNALANIATSFIINKRFEKQADQFAAIAGKGHELIEFLECVKQKELDYDQDCHDTYKLLQEHATKLSANDMQELNRRYNISYYINKFAQWLYYQTPIGAHPLTDERIKAAHDYLDLCA